MGVITVTVRLYGTLPRYVPGYDPEAGISMQLEEGSTYRNLMEILGLPPEEARVIIVRGASRKASDVVSDHEEIAFFLPMAGG